TYRSTIIVDTRVAGRLRIGRVYNHWDPEFSNYIHFRVNADLWAPDLCRTNPHYDNANKNSGVGYQGVSNENNETPWFRGKSYEEATSERRFEYLMIPELTSPYTDSLGNAEYRIYGSNVNGIPLSKIEYLGNDISKITLHYNISRVGTNIVDQVIEEYTPLE
ncbi:MAG: hypothetical protein GX879_09555, partial [Bacteroidales bacterium]|nr:hypothetical protein [Bacteroidales bacterium]